MTTPYYSDESVTLYHGHDLDVLRTLPDGSVNCVVTSPPYFGLRDYGQDGQRGLEYSPAEYVAGLVEVFAEMRRVLAVDGTAWLNIGDSYVAGGSMTGVKSPRQRLNNSHLRNETIARGTADLPAKNLLGIPWRVALALQDDGWTLRNDIIWSKPNAMPESVTDRLSTRHEHVFLLTKSRNYWFDLDAIREPVLHPNWSRPNLSDGKNSDIHRLGATSALRNAYTPNPRGRNPGDVWEIPTMPFSGTVRRTARQDPDRRDPDAPAYGKRRIASTDCPLHGSEGPQGSTALRDGRAEAPSSHSADNGGSPDPAQASGSAPTPHPCAPSTAHGSSDSPAQRYEPSATPHSSGTHRTAPAPSTSQPYTPSDQTPTGTERNEGQLAFDAPGTSTSESSNGGPASREQRARKTGRTARKCTCAWVDDTASTSHFAVMPLALAERCILAGCKPGGTVLDPYSGSGTTGLAATKHGRRYIGIDLSRDYLDLSLRTRLRQGVLEVSA